MKMKNLKIAALVVASAALFAGCEGIEQLGSSPSATITALSDTFDAQGEAVVQVALSSYALEDVTVVLSASGDYAAAVSMDKAVKIPIGTKTGNVTVKIDLSQVSADSSIKVAITSATGATVGSPSEATIAVKAGAVKEEAAVLSIEADEEFAQDATATVTLKLNKALKEAVTVELAVLSSDDYETIDAQALSFQNPVTIAAGQTSASVKVTLNPEVLPTGDNYALIGIKSVDGNANPAKTAEVLIIYTKQIVASLRQDWTITYNGYNSDGYDTIGLNVGSDTQTYYIAIYYGGTIAANFDSVSEYLQWFESVQVAPYLGTEEAELIRTGNITARYNRLDPETYEFFIIGCTEEGHVTGEYGTTTFTVEPTSDMLAAVEAFLGKWVVNHHTWNIESAGGVYFTITGVEGEDDLPVEAFVNWDGNLEIQNQPFIYEDDTQAVGLYGLAGNNLWTTSGFTIVEAVLAEDGESAVLTPAISPGGAPFESMAFLQYMVSDQKFYLYSDQIALPATMTRPQETVAETTPVKAGAYEDFLGTWRYGDFDILVEPVEGKDTLYYVSGFPGQSQYDRPVAVFTDGALVLSEQSLGTWDNSNYGKCVDLFNAVFPYNGNEYRAYGWNTDTPAVVFTAQLHESGNLTFAPGTVTLNFNDGSSQDVPVIGLVYSWMIIEESSEYYGRGNYASTMYIDGSIAVTPVAATASSVKAAKKAARQMEGLSVSAVSARQAAKTAKVSLKDRVIR